MSTSELPPTLQGTGAIVGNTVFGVLLLALVPFAGSELLTIGPPSGRVEAITFGFYLALAVAPFIMLLLAYAAYTERE